MVSRDCAIGCFRRNNFDFIRLVAALQVATLHAAKFLKLEMPNWLFQMLDLIPGVPIFFIISGFLVAASWERSGSLSVFFKNRFLRVYPGLWFCFIFGVFTVILLGKFNASVTNFLIWAVAQNTIFQFYNPEFLRGYGVGVLNGSLWTISIELQFYFFVPLIFSIFKKVNANFVLIFLLAVSALVNQYYTYHLGLGVNFYEKLLGATLFAYLYFFTLGVFLYKNFELFERLLSGRLIIIISAYGFLACFFYSVGVEYSGSNLNPLSGMFLALLVFSFAYSFNGSLGKIINGFDISYGIYIYHMIIVNAIIEIGVSQTNERAILFFMTTFLCALTSWVFVEKPMLRLKSLVPA